MATIRLMRGYKSVEIVVGPYLGKLAWGRGYFGWREGDRWFTRLIRRWWSGFHRWDEE